jgi:4-carboxymuconolactone decarboxylase
MPAAATNGDTLLHLDDATRLLLRVAATVAGSDEIEVRGALQRAAPSTPPQWIEELLLQTYLFAGFPRALNAMREWRRIAPEPAPDVGSGEAAADVRQLGEATCARVYGRMYERLRENIRALHPLLDEWMILEGYGKVLSRPQLDLPRRELCIVAACAATAQDRQLQSHLHGAVNVGVPSAVITAALVSLRDVIPEAFFSRSLRLWERIRSSS